MKIFISALVILLTITCITFGVSSYTAKKADFFFTRIEETSEKEDLSFCQNEYESLIEKWKKSYFLLSVANTHSDLLRIEEEFASVMGSFKANDRNEFLIHSKRLAELFKNLKNNAKFKASNIF